MPKLSQKNLEDFVGKKIIEFHSARLNRITKINLVEVLQKKNPYLFRAKNMHKTNDLISSILDAFVSSSEEELFGIFLEELAIFVSNKCNDGTKSSATGLDLEFERNKVRYLVAIKSGPNWGNKSQYDTLKLNFRNAVKVLKQSKSTLNVQPVLGICYGKFKTVNNRPLAQ